MVWPYSAHGRASGLSRRNCKWCGKELRKDYEAFSNPTKQGTWRGPMSNGYFCSKTCGFAYATYYMRRIEMESAWSEDVPYPDNHLTRMLETRMKAETWFQRFSQPKKRKGIILPTLKPKGDHDQ